MISESGSEGSPEGLSLVLWREGLLAMHNSGYFLVESFYDHVSNNACFDFSYFLMVSNITLYLQKCSIFCPFRYNVSRTKCFIVLYKNV